MTTNRRDFLKRAGAALGATGAAIAGHSPDEVKAEVPAPEKAGPSNQFMPVMAAAQFREHDLWARYQQNMIDRQMLGKRLHHTEWKIRPCPKCDDPGPHLEGWTDDRYALDVCMSCGEHMIDREIRANRQVNRRSLKPRKDRRNEWWWVKSKGNSKKPWLLKNNRG